MSFSEHLGLLQVCRNCLLDQGRSPEKMEQFF